MAIPPPFAVLLAFPSPAAALESPSPTAPAAVVVPSNSPSEKSNVLASPEPLPLVPTVEPVKRSEAAPDAASPPAVDVVPLEARPPKKYGNKPESVCVVTVPSPPASLVVVPRIPPVLALCEVPPPTATPPAFALNKFDEPDTVVEPPPLLDDDTEPPPTDVAEPTAPPDALPLVDATLERTVVLIGTTALEVSATRVTNSTTVAVVVAHITFFIVRHKKLQ